MFKGNLICHLAGTGEANNRAGSLLTFRCLMISGTGPDYRIEVISEQLSGE